MVNDFAQVDALQNVTQGPTPVIGGKPVVAKPKVNPMAPTNAEEVTKKPEPVQPVIGGKQQAQRKPTPPPKTREEYMKENALENATLTAFKPDGTAFHVALPAKFTKNQIESAASALNHSIHPPNEACGGGGPPPFKSGDAQKSSAVAEADKVK